MKCVFGRNREYIIRSAILTFKSLKNLCTMFYFERESGNRKEFYCTLTVWLLWAGYTSYSMGEDARVVHVEGHLSMWPPGLFMRDIPVFGLGTCMVKYVLSDYKKCSLLWHLGHQFCLWQPERSFEFRSVGDGWTR